jgi:diguanylate cyclase (GGDEF)-like protein/PAS domain S-box-containing protein
VNTGNSLPAVPWHRSLRFKLVLTAIVVEVFMLGLLLANSYRLVGAALETQTQARLNALQPLLNASLAGRVFQRDHSEIQSILRQLVTAHSDIRYIVVLGPQGRLIAHVGELPPEAVMRLERDASVHAQLGDLTYDATVTLTLPGDLTVGKVFFGLSLQRLVDLRDNVLRQSLGIAAIEILASLLLLTTLGYLLTRHIASLLAATRRVASADFSQPIAIDTRDEIGILAEDFNRMQEEIQRRIGDLAESELRFRAIFDAAGDAIFIHEAKSGNLLDVNRRMCEMYGCTREEALTLPPETFCSEQAPYSVEQAFEKLRLARSTEQPLTFDWKARRRDGTEFWVEVNLRLVRIGSDERLLALVRDISERKRYQQRLEFLAHHDPLTKLPNRLLFADRLQQALARARRSQRLLAVVMLDLDGFKPVNDTLGHDVGDILLTQVAQRLRECVRAGDTVSRLGGDEFALLIGDLTSVDEGYLAYQRLLDSLGTTYRIDAHTLNISASIGVTMFPFDDADSDTLLRHADQAMYVAKQKGRNRYHLFDAEHDRLSQAEIDRRKRIALAIEHDEFVMHYQPQVDLQSGRVIGAEALIRWQHPVEGLLPPVRFLPIVEDSELAIPLGDWVIDSVLAQAQAWHQSGLALKIGINIAARHLQAPDFIDRLTALLARFPGIPHGTIELEVVESVALDDIARVGRVIESCHALGVTFALDDFGTGYSSLSYFKRLKIDTLKIDQSFIRDMLVDEEDHAIVEGVIGLTRSFRREVIAEGVESVEIGTALLALGCRYAQGYGIARPMPAAELSGWIENWKSDPAWRV